MTDKSNPDRLDPELEGLPTVVDETSTAFDEGDRPRFEDGTPIPRDRWIPVDDGASLAERLRQEMPDTVDDPYAESDEDAPDTLYDEDLSRPVGRLMDPDMGGPVDDESQAYAIDTHERGGLSAEEAAMHLTDVDEP